MTSRSLLVARTISLSLACFGLAACAGEGDEEGKPGVGISLGGSAGSAGNGSLEVGGRAGAPDAGAGGDTAIGPEDCDCVAVDPLAEEGPGYFVMGSPKDSCAGDERAFFRGPNPAKCAPPSCVSTGASYYESSCVGGEPVQGEYQSGVDDYATCRPLALPTRGSVLFGSALVYWSCSPGDAGPAFDQQLCARHFPPPAANACPPSTICVPRSAGPVCVRAKGAPPAGWVKGDYANPSRCTGEPSELTSPMQVTIFDQADCSGNSASVEPDTCATFVGTEPRAYVIDPPADAKTPAALEVLEDVADLHCRP